ncbi:MAG: hypothetical protein EOO28_23885 [Comamonadaceae bacterium]|nr:MAG: hypothetical protein EOO28_23885 [Comamonadaceae bacterium]
MQDSTVRDLNPGLTGVSNGGVVDLPGAPRADRRLNDSVLQSAEETVLTPQRDEHAEAMGFEAGDYSYRQPAKGAVATYVAEHPVQAALIAAGAGALLMVLLKQGVRSRSFSGARDRVSSRFSDGLSRVRKVKVKGKLLGWRW